MLIQHGVVTTLIGDSSQFFFVYNDKNSDITIAQISTKTNNMRVKISTSTAKEIPLRKFQVLYYIDIQTSRLRELLEHVANKNTFIITA